MGAASLNGAQPHILDVTLVRSPWLHTSEWEERRNGFRGETELTRSWHERGGRLLAPVGGLEQEKAMEPGGCLLVISFQHPDVARIPVQPLLQERCLAREGRRERNVHTLDPAVCLREYRAHSTRKQHGRNNPLLSPIGRHDASRVGICRPHV